MECRQFFRPVIRAGIMAFAILAVAGGAHASDPSLTDLELYASTSLVGVHSHPIGFEGRKIEAAERDINRRRAFLREWLAIREGALALDELDKENAEGVLWIRGPSVEDEWNTIRLARKNLRELERRKRITEIKGN